MKKVVTKTKMKRKGLALGDLAPAAIMFVVAFVTLAFGAKILTDFQAQNAAGPITNVTSNATAGAVALAAYAPTIGTVLAGSIVIGILISAFMKQQ
jgi:hypothetical protein